MAGGGGFFKSRDYRDPGSLTAREKNRERTEAKKSKRGFCFDEVTMVMIE